MSSGVGVLDRIAEALPSPEHLVTAQVRVLIEVGHQHVVVPDPEHAAGLQHVLGLERRVDDGLAAGTEVEVEPEGPQRADPAADVTEALAADPQVGEFFDALAQFYRRGYLRWVGATKRSPDLRAQRIAPRWSISALPALSGVKGYRGH